MWIALSLLSAAGAAGVGLALKSTLTWGGAVASTVDYRVVGGVLLLPVVAAGAAPTLGSTGAVLLVSPLLPKGLPPAPASRAGARSRWEGWAGVCGGLYAVQQLGLQFALRDAPAGYVTALSATSIGIAVLGGVALLGERAGGGRLAGGFLATSGAVLVALYG